MFASFLMYSKGLSINTVLAAEPNIFLRICTQTMTITISSGLCPPMPTHSMTCAHPCPPMLFKLRPCIQKLCNVYYPPTPSLGWIGQMKGCSLSLASARSASWLAYSLHTRSLTPIWSWMQGCTKLMPTHAHPWTIILHPCPPINNNMAPMPTQNPWAWAPDVGLCLVVPT
jgi:hypothetical protein